jgi:hypothetical protein
MPNAMQTSKIKNVNQTLGFFSITIAWALMNLFYSIYLGWSYRKAHESGVIIFWSGLFIYIAWAIFIIYPLNKLEHSRSLFKTNTLPFVCGLYAAFIFSILVGGLFRNLELVVKLMPLAIIVGVIFGLAYSSFIRFDKLVNILNERPAYKIILFISPVIILTFFLWLLPTIVPSFVFRYMPDEVQDKIFVNKISAFKVGDSFRQLDNSVPGYFNEWIINGNGGISSNGPLIDYQIEVKNDTLIKLEMTLHK